MKNKRIIRNIIIGTIIIGIFIYIAEVIKPKVKTVVDIIPNEQLDQ